MNVFYEVPMIRNVQREMHSIDIPDPPPRDAQPDPEPAVPSLPEPDPGVFHHEPTPLAPSKPASPTTKDSPA